MAFAGTTKSGNDPTILAWLNRAAHQSDPHAALVITYEYDPQTGMFIGRDRDGNTVTQNDTLAAAINGGTVFNVGGQLIVRSSNGDYPLGSLIDQATFTSIAHTVGATPAVQTVTPQEYQAQRGTQAYGYNPPGTATTPAGTPTPGASTGTGNQPFGQGFGTDQGLQGIIAAGDPNAGFTGNTNTPGTTATGSPASGNPSGYQSIVNNTPSGLEYAYDAQGRLVQISGTDQSTSNGLPAGKSFLAPGDPGYVNPNTAFNQVPGYISRDAQGNILQQGPPLPTPAPAGAAAVAAGRDVTRGTVGTTTPVSAANAARVGGVVAPIGTSSVNSGNATAPVTSGGSPALTVDSSGTLFGRPVNGAAPATAAGAGTADQRNAYSDLQSVLSQYGLGSLAGWAWNEIVGGASEAQVLLDMYQRPEFKAAFPEITARQQAGLPPLTPADVINYRTQATQIMRDAGLPAGFWDSPTDFSALLTSDVSLSELQQRVGLASQAAFQVPADVRATLQRDYGVGAGQLAAFFLDPKTAEPLLAQQFTAAQIGGAAYRTGYGSTKGEDEYLTSLGVNAQQAQQGFTQLTGQRQLFDSLPGENTTGISRDQQLGAAFAGNTLDQEAITRRAQTRAAQFAGGGAFSAGQTGFSGVGQAPGV